MIIALNGPPRVGKSTFCDMLSLAFNDKGSKVFQEQFKNGLFDLLNLEVLFPKHQFSTEEGYEKCKEERPELRLVLRAVSENVVKPIFGKDFWAEYIISNIKEDIADGYIVVIPDLGFDAEVDKLKENFDDVLIVQLRRDGIDFSEDSRHYVDADIIFDNLTLESTQAAVDRVIAHIMATNVLGE